jgi:hypothetical protein
MSGADMSTQLGLPAGQASPASSRTTGFASPCINLPSAPVGELYSGCLQQLCVKLEQQHTRSLHAGEGMSLCTAAADFFCLQGNGTADGYGNFVGTGSLESTDGYFQGSGTFVGAGDCEGTQVYSAD